MDIITFCKLVVISMVLCFFFSTPNALYKGYLFDRDIGSYCELAYDASDIDQKIDYFDECYDKMIKENLQGYSVWWFKKPNKKLSNLYEVMASLKTRMHNLKSMDKSSFEYQTGLAQVEEEIGYFVHGEESKSHVLYDFKKAYCFKHTWTKYLC